SCPIDLATPSGVTYPNASDQANYQNSLYLSWYWQKQGNGELPDAEDSLRLEFLDAEGIWQSIWSVTGEVEVAINEWTFESIQIPFDLWHGQFQFRFTSYARRTANFDSWHIDYVYLDVWRTENDPIIRDRTLVSAPGSIFGEYSALPRHHFDPSQDVSPISARIDNLSASNPFVFRLLATLTNDDTDDVVAEIQDFSNFIGQEQIDVALQAPDGDAIATALNQQDSALNLRLSVRLISNDTLLESEDPVEGTTQYDPRNPLSANDTLSRKFTLDNYYAYDDGTAEYIAGMATVGGSVVYEYEVREPDTITHIDAYFPAVKGNNQTPTIQLILLSALDDAEESLLSTSTITLRPSETTNAFFRYPLAEPVVVEGTVYLGWRQQTNSFIGVGLDKSSDSGPRMYSNIRGEWTQNELVEGNLMLRPVLDRVVPDTTVTSLPGYEEEWLKLYPNPARDECYIEGNLLSVQIVDNMGRLIALRPERITAQRYRFDLASLPRGMYYLRAVNQAGQPQTRKLILID
ncbi:MAG: T9SS type A sorting domain-containing protein, partial [Bacteroidota bacterium]